MNYLNGQSYADELFNTIYEIPFSVALFGTVPSPFYLLGNYEVIQAGLNATWNPAGGATLGGNQLALDVTVLTGSGTVTVTGDSINRSTGVVTVGDTENITVNAIAEYRTDKRWLRVTQVLIPGGITVITYEAERIGLYNMSSQNFKIVGWRMSPITNSLTLGSLRLQMYRVHDLGSKKYENNTLEDITYDAGTGAADGITDNLRAGGDSRTRLNSGTNIFSTTTLPSRFRQSDFDTYFASGQENHILGSLNGEGLRVVFTWSNIDYMTFFIRYKYLG